MGTIVDYCHDIYTEGISVKSISKSKTINLKKSKIHYELGTDTIFKTIELKVDDYKSFKIFLKKKFIVIDSELFTDYNFKIQKLQKICFNEVFLNILCLLQTKNIEEKKKDKYMIFYDNKKESKVKLNYNNLEKYFKENILKGQPQELSKYINKNLLYTASKVYNLILKEIENINSTFDYIYKIIPEDDCIYNLNVVFNYLDKEIIFKIQIEPYFYPFVPPILSCDDKNVDIKMKYTLQNLDILKKENWNATISLESLMNEIFNEFTPYFDKYINENINNLQYHNLMCSLILATSEDTSYKIPIKLNFTNLIKTDTKSKNYWTSGTGYSSRNTDGWNIDAYLNNKNNQTKHIFNIMESIICELPSIDITIINNSILPSYLNRKLTEFNILDICDNQYENDLFVSVFKSIKLINKCFNKNTDFTKFIEFLSEGINYLHSIYSSLKINKTLDFDFELINYIIEHYKVKKDTKEDEDNTEKGKYLKLIDEEKIGDFELDKNHHYFKKKNSLVNSMETTNRVSSEMFTISKDLPNTWDSSIIARFCEDQINYMTFMIVGPKDTPYNNGLFLFDTMFPNTYPHTNPLVNLRTTGHGKVRFNPNLYNCGKVCLSLLGTWSGSEGETWNKKTSTFLQILISIQSLILVDEPYFNEPGYEREIGTEIGIKRSKKYNSVIRKGTIEWAMIDMIKNPPHEYKNFIINHFKIKKNEIKDVVNIWIKEESNEEFTNTATNLFETLDSI
jgi:ubiquitin-protein ligase